MQNYVRYLFHWYLMVKWVWVVCLFSFLFHFDLPTKEIIQSSWRRKGYRRRETVPKQTKPLSIFFIERSVLFCTVMQSFMGVIHCREILYIYKAAFKAVWFLHVSLIFDLLFIIQCGNPAASSEGKKTLRLIQTVFVKVNWLILWLPWSESLHQVNLHHFT